MYSAELPRRYGKNRSGSWGVLFLQRQFVKGLSVAVEERRLVGRGNLVALHQLADVVLATLVCDFGSARISLADLIF